MQPKLIYARALICLAVAAAAVPALAAEPAAPAKTITVSGEGEVKSVPDEAVLTAGVVTQSAKADDALAANRRAMNAVFASLKAQGIPDRAIRTSQFTVSPQFDTGHDGNAPPKLVGYQVSNTVSVTIDDLSKLGSAIDALVASGANSMGGIGFTIKDPKPLLRQAREAAVKDAMDQAQTYAKAAGVTLGRIVTIGEGGGEAPRPLFHAMAVMAEQPTPIAPGEQSVTAQVTMTFEIK